MGYSSSGHDGARRMARFKRVEKREDDKEKREAALVLMDISSSSVGIQSTTWKENLDPIVTDEHAVCKNTISELQKEVESLYVQLEKVHTENKNLREENKRVKFGPDTISTDRDTQFYTGLPTNALFLWMVTFCSTVLPHSKLLSPASVLLMILMKLRLNLHHRDLSHRFSISLTTVSELINQGIPRVAEKLSFLIQWPDKEILKKTMPSVFRETYPKCVSIIDCFEIFIQRPGQLGARTQTWSNYKHHNTLKFLVSITPTGSISFLSKPFGGRTSDKVITQRSGYLDKLEHGDCVLADRGFLIAEDLASHHAYLVIPAFTKGKSQLSAKEVEQTRKIARVRIHVERAIERIKNFNILSGNMSIHMVPHSASIVIICAAVSNLLPKLVS